MDPIIPESIQEKLNRLAADKADDLLRRARSVLSGSKYVGRGELLNSLEVTYTHATGDKSPVITLQFADQGKFLEVKRMIFGKVADIKNWSSGLKAEASAAFAM
ncbi:MAG: hypothetical protein WDO15_11500 [Bacteroidota bacterium]